MQTLTATMKLKDIHSLEENVGKSRQHIEKQNITLPTELCLVKAMAFQMLVK